MKDCSWPLYSFHNRLKNGGITFSPYQINCIDADAEQRAEEYRRWKEGDESSPESEEVKIDQSMLQDTISGRPAHVMSFTDAVQSVLIKNYVVFEGRASRSEYGWFILFLYLLILATGLIGGPEILKFTILPLIFPIISLTVRRIHDIGKSGWWFLLVFVPGVIIIIPIILLIIDGEDGPNKYGAVPTNTLEQDGNIHTN